MRGYFKSNGFTLLEILVASACAGVVGVILITIMVQGNGLFLNQSTQISHSLSLNSSVTTIHDSIKYASSIAATHTQGSVQYVSGLSTVIVKIPSIDSQKRIIDNKFDTVIITFNPQKIHELVKYTFPDPLSSRPQEAKVLLSNLSKVSFYYLDSSGASVVPSAATTVDFAITIAEKSNYGIKEASTSSRVNLKNL